MIAFPWIEIHGYHVGHAYGIFSEMGSIAFRGLKSTATMSVVPMVLFGNRIDFFSVD
ncbi:hypothetical protein [Dyadobacter sp. 3J3]|uniref:hypothetical protein n=1 Tax=Dyadobacter sp. 3J3 TaxID=2606600 RepID=UPI00135CD5E1|nr:hypothetical protein [Dyadobacter sp. 3J3]